MTSGQQGVTITHDKSTSGRLAVEGAQVRKNNDALAVDCMTTKSE